MAIGIVLYLIILLFSAILHEIAHGAVAEYFGDDTARMMGRISLNPIVHIDLYFTILLPLILFLSGSPVIFGAAKPVPVNYFRLRNFRWGVFWVSAAGILTNLIIAFAFALPLRLMSVSPGIASVFTAIAEINIFLAVVNMIPIPPIDGSKVLAALLGEGMIKRVMSIEMRGIWGVLPFIILIFILFSTSGFQSVMLPVVNFFFRILGLPPLF
ncbi:site-2 protease family protein [Patescibacteria group bacterium]|nr:site-2 protease family protein [Patescibacteria group bacterium]